MAIVPRLLRFIVLLLSNSFDNTLIYYVSYIKYIKKLGLSIKAVDYLYIDLY